MYHKRNEYQIRKYEEEYRAGLMEGQARKPTIFWCKCVQDDLTDVPRGMPSCPICKGSGYVHRK